MRRRHRRNYKFWAIVRLKSKRHYGRRKHFSSSRKSHNYLSKNYGGWKDETKKYRNKGHFDPVKYVEEHSKPKKRKRWISHYKGAPRTKPSDYERKGRSPLDALKAWARSLGHYE